MVEILVYFQMMNHLEFILDQRIVAQDIDVIEEVIQVLVVLVMIVLV